jgi:hypothetical protein
MRLFSCLSRSGPSTFPFTGKSRVRADFAEGGSRSIMNSNDRRGGELGLPWEEGCLLMMKKGCLFRHPFRNINRHASSPARGTTVDSCPIPDRSC